MFSILSTGYLLLASSALPADEHGPGAVELLHVGKNDLLTLGEPVEDLDLGDAGRAGADLPQGGEAVGEDVDLAPAAALEERPARRLEDIGVPVEDQAGRDALVLAQARGLGAGKGDGALDLAVAHLGRDGGHLAR